MPNRNNNEFTDETEDPNDPQLTELVAYLDGELDDHESTRLERKLAENPPLRGYAETLDRTWQLLDSLGEATASGEFTQKTLASLESVSLDDEDSVKTAGSMWRRVMAGIPLLQIILWTSAGFLGCSVGLLMSRAPRTQKADTDDIQILRNLDLLKDYPKIYPIPSAEFLQKISTLETPSTEKEGNP